MRLMIDPGHGGFDPGAVFGGLSEKDIVLDIGTRLGLLLRASDIEFNFTRTKDVFLSLGQRCNLANAWKATHFLSIHTNADADEDLPGMPEAQGEEIFYVSKKGKLFATRMGKAIQAELPDEPWRGIKERGLHVLVHTKMPAILVETAFIDRSATNRALHLPETRAQIAFALLRGIGLENVGEPV